jgi:hypothetical protein
MDLGLFIYGITFFLPISKFLTCLLLFESLYQLVVRDKLKADGEIF